VRGGVGLTLPSHSLTQGGTSVAAQRTQEVIIYSGPVWDIVGKRKLVDDHNLKFLSLLRKSITRSWTSAVNNSYNFLKTNIVIAVLALLEIASSLHPTDIAPREQSHLLIRFGD
jgi:hypothetical protein